MENSIIDKAVKDAIDDYLASIKKSDISSARIDGDIPDISKYLMTFDNIESFDDGKKIVDEGLIKTYPVDKSVNFIIRKYNLNNNQIQVKSVNNGIIEVNVILMILPNTIDSNTIGNIKHDLQTCGYFNSQTPRQIPNTNSSFFVFEPKFSNDVSELIKSKFRYLYHSTPAIYVDKIAKNGLIPKSKNSIFLYPDRTFLMAGDKLDYEQVKTLKKVQGIRNAHISSKNPTEKKEYALVVIDVASLPPNVRFFCDPMSSRAIYTYDNIPPSAIRNIEPFTL